MRSRACLPALVGAATIASAGCNRLERDLDDLCQAANAVQRRADLGVSAKLAMATGTALEGAKSEVFSRIIGASLASDPENSYELVQVGAREAGVPGWSCPALERLYSLKETLVIREGQLVVNGRGVASVPQRPDPAVRCDQRMDALERALRPLAATTNQGTLAVVPEPNTPYCLVSRILHTGWGVGFKRVKVGEFFARAVKKEKSGEQLKLQLCIAVGGPGILLAGAGGRLSGKDGDPWSVGCLGKLEQGRCPTSDGRGGRYDYKLLREKLEQIRKQYPDERYVAVSMDDGAQYGVLRRLLGALTGSDAGQQQPASRRFDFGLGTVEQLNRRLGFNAFERRSGAIVPAARWPEPSPRQRGGLGELPQAKQPPRAAGGRPMPIVEVRRFETDGGLPGAGARRVVRRGAKGLRACYKRALRTRPRLTGQMLVHLSINKMGRVTRTQIDRDSMADRALNACITRLATRWRFPPPENETDIEIPVIFSIADLPQ